MQSSPLKRKAKSADGGEDGSKKWCDSGHTENLGEDAEGASDDAEDATSATTEEAANDWEALKQRITGGKALNWDIKCIKFGGNVLQAVLGQGGKLGNEGLEGSQKLLLFLLRETMDLG